MNSIPQSPRARIISIGDELLRNRIANSNGAQISARLEAMGIRVHKIVTIGDREEEIVEEINSFLLSQENLFFLTGGLGPTHDDRTIVAVAQALKVKLVNDPDYFVSLEAMRKEMELPLNFLKQAIVPQGFTVEKNPFGSAPFLYLVDQADRSKRETSPKLWFLLPGVPFECLSLLEHRVIPLIKKKFFSLSHQEYFLEMKCISIAESVVEEKLKNLRKKLGGANDGVNVAFLPSLGELLIRFRGEDPVYLRQITRQLKAAFPQHQSYIAPLNTSIPSVTERLHRFFFSKQWRIGFVESCTGGLLTSSFVSLPGSSVYLDSGAITYSDEAKIFFCGVSTQTLKKHGAVSFETAEEMAVGLAKKRKLHLVVSITGIAGPSGGSKEKPVGLVYIALYLKPPRSKTLITSQKFYLGNKKNQKKRGFPFENRNRIRERAAKNALFMMMEVCFPLQKPTHYSL